MHTNIIIIGAGPGGYETAVHAAKQGLSVTIFEERKPGGTCLNEGCIPTKSFCKNAEVMEQLKEAEVYGIEHLSYSFDFQKVVERKNQVVELLNAGIDSLMQHKLITYVKGKAQLKDAHTVVANGEEYSADYILIATGSVTKLLPVPGMNLPGVLTSKEMLDIDHIPERLCVIGAGVIGLEFASIFHRFGSKVTVVEYAKEILPNFDTDIAKRLKQTLGKRGIEIVNQAKVGGVAKQGDTLAVSYEYKGEQKVCEADTVLVAVGRAANVEALNLQDIGIEYSPKGISVNENMQTNIPHIYAIGDVNGLCMLAHAATFQGLRALHHIQKQTDSIRLDIIPAAVFTSPEAAMVGLTEEQCKEKGIAFVTKKAFFRANGKALAMNEPDGFCKLIVSSEDERILGCHLFGAHSADLIQEVCAMMNKEVTLTEFKQVIHGHPTLGEVLQSALFS
jgi:dihydrolipoamide dehydrogenase